MGVHLYDFHDFVPLNLKFEIRNPKLFNNPVRSSQHVRWNRQADLFRRLQLDDELELDRLLHWQIGGLSPLEVLSIITRQI
jgi:hypothetical protein